MRMEKEQETSERCAREAEISNEARSGTECDSDGVQNILAIG